MTSILVGREQRGVCVYISDFYEKKYLFVNGLWGTFLGSWKSQVGIFNSKCQVDAVSRDFISSIFLRPVLWPVPQKLNICFSKANKKAVNFS